MQTGDVVFVHRLSQAMGHGYNRMIKCTGLPMLNSMLSNAVPGVTTFDTTDTTLAARVKQQRVAHWKGEIQATLLDKHSEKDPEVKAAAAAARLFPEGKLAEAEAIDENEPLASIELEIDWRAVSMLSDWSVDGVLINVDDDVDVDDSERPLLSRDDGILMNVAVQGPTPLRNTRWEAHCPAEQHPLQHTTQHIDANIVPLDKVFAGLFAYQDEGTEPIRFYYKLFTGRQLFFSHLVRIDPSQVDPVAKGSSEVREAEFSRLIGAWRVGSVMDNRLTTDVERMVQLCVCVEWWSLRKLQRELDDDQEGVNVSRIGQRWVLRDQAIEAAERQSANVFGDGDGPPVVAIEARPPV